MKNSLEFLANTYKEQIWLEEILNNNLDKSETVISSVYGEENLVSANETAVMDLLCRLMASPPATCAFQRT